MATLKDNQTTNSGLGFYFPSEYDRLGYGQTVTPSENYTVEQIKFYASKSKLNPGNCYVSIETTAGGLPTGNKITDNAVFACPDTKTLMTVTFTTQPVLQSGTKYAIVFENPNGVIGTPGFYDDAVRLQIYGAVATGAYYANGELVYLETAGWANNVNQDLYFQLWGSDPTPTKATNPSPTDAATSVDFSALGLSWDDGGGADTFDVWIGPSGSLVEVSSAQAGTTFTVDTSDVPWGETIYWRIDSTNAYGTTTGDVWSFSVVNINSVWMGSGGNFIVVAADDGVFLSTDFGANWTRKTPDAVETTDWTKGICSSTGTYIVAVSSANAIYKSANGGAAWEAITPAGGDTFAVSDLAMSDDGQFMVIVGTNSTDPTKSCYVSINYGINWTSYKPVAASIAWTECDISNDGAVIAVSRPGYIYVSFDSGATWLEQSMAASGTNYACFSISGDGNTGLVCNTVNANDFFVGTESLLYSQSTWAESDLTSAGRALLDDANAAAQATTLGLGTEDNPTFADLTLSSPSNIYTLSHNSFADYVANEHIDWTNTSENLTTTGTIDAHAGKVLVEDNDTVAPDTQENGYVGVAVVDGTARLYFSSGGTMYYIDGTAVEIQAIETGNPMPWLFYFTYTT